MFKAWREARKLRQYIAMADSPEFWTQEDSQALVKFMVNGTGRKLRARINNMVYRAAMAACVSEKDSERHVARGITILASFIDQHLPQQEDKDFAQSTGASVDTSDLADLPTR